MGWEAQIYNRSIGKGCPYCSNKKIHISFNDLKTTHKELVKQWNYDKNKNLLPQNFTCGSHKKVWWLCDKGHEWEAAINMRKKGYGCPYCSGRKVLKGFNDLETKNIRLASEWHPTKNGNLKPTDLTSHSGKKVWWLCDKGHEWDATIYNRINGQGCPYCANKKILSGYNDFAFRYPEIVIEWDYAVNGDLNPEQIFPRTKKEVGWICNECNHKWNAQIANRVKGSGCPECSKKKKRLEKMKAKQNVA